MPIAIPLIIWQISTDAVVRKNAKEAINFFINYLAFSFSFGLIFALLMTENLVLPRPLTLLYLGVMAIVTLIIMALPAVAVISVLVNPFQPHHYPFIRRVF